MFITQADKVRFLPSIQVSPRSDFHRDIEVLASWDYVPETGLWRINWTSDFPNESQGYKTKLRVQLRHVPATPSDAEPVILMAP